MEGDNIQSISSGKSNSSVRAVQYLPVNLQSRMDSGRRLWEGEGTLRGIEYTERERESE